MDTILRLSLLANVYEPWDHGECRICNRRLVQKQVEEIAAIDRILIVGAN